MHISWLGQTCVKLVTKNLDEDVNIIIDGYKPKTGDFPRSFSPQIALYSHGEENTTTLSQNPFVISTLGECEVKNVMMYALPGGEDNLIFSIGAEGLTIVHLGRMTKPLENGDLEKILSPDILFIPVGDGENGMDPKAAAALANSLEARIIIPIAHKCDTDPGAKAVSAFIAELGLKPEATEKKVIIKKKDLPQEETKLIVLEKEY